MAGVCPEKLLLKQGEPLRRVDTSASRRRLELVDQTGAGWNQIIAWLHRLEAIRCWGCA